MTVQIATAILLVLCIARTAVGCVDEQLNLGDTFPVAMRPTGILGGPG